MIIHFIYVEPDKTQFAWEKQNENKSQSQLKEKLKITPQK